MGRLVSMEANTNKNYDNIKEKMAFG